MMSERVAHRYAYFAFLCGFSLRVREQKHRNAARIGEDPWRNADYANLATCSCAYSGRAQIRLAHSSASEAAQTRRRAFDGGKVVDFL